MSIVGGCPICGAMTALFSVLIPGTHHTRYICEDCENDINREQAAKNTCLGCGEVSEECSCPELLMYDECSCTQDSEQKAGAA